MIINRFEAIGIGASVGVMALALWLIQLETATETLARAGSVPTDSGLVFIEEGTNNQAAAVANAIVSASEGGELSKLVIDDVVLGNGVEASASDTVVVHYTGTLQNGQQFDSSYERGTPFTFELGKGRVIDGWEQGIAGMKVGGKRILVIPSELAYGASGAGPIPPNATLVFAVEMLEIK